MSILLLIFEIISIVRYKLYVQDTYLHLAILSQQTKLSKSSVFGE